MIDEIVVIHYPDVRQENWHLLEQAARERRIRLVTWQPHLISEYLWDAGTEVRYDGQDVRPPVLLHRTVSPFRGLMIPALTFLAEHGTLVLNDITAAFRSRDKVLTTLALRAAGVPIVPTLVVDEPGPELNKVMDAGAVIFKPAHGVRGMGIAVYHKGDPWRQENLRPRQQRQAVRAGYHIEREHYLAQPLIAGGGADMRAYVVDGACVALMGRIARGSEVRANLALGADGHPLELAHPAAAVAEAAIAACELDYGAVDLIQDDIGITRVLEVDAWGGFSGITAVTGADVAGAILDFAARKLR